MMRAQARRRTRRPRRPRTEEFLRASSPPLTEGWGSRRPVHLSACPGAKTAAPATAGRLATAACLPAGRGYIYTFKPSCVCLSCTTADSRIFVRARGCYVQCNDAPWGLTVMRTALLSFFAILILTTAAFAQDDKPLGDIAR